MGNANGLRPTKIMLLASWNSLKTVYSNMDFTQMARGLGMLRRSLEVRRRSIALCLMRRSLELEGEVEPYV